MFQKLSLHPAVGIACRQSLNLISRDKIEVAIDCMLQSRGSHGKLQGLTLRLLREESMDKSA